MTSDVDASLSAFQRAAFELGLDFSLKDSRRSVEPPLGAKPSPLPSEPLLEAYLRGRRAGRSCAAERLGYRCGRSLEREYEPFAAAYHEALLSLEHLILRESEGLDEGASEAVRTMLRNHFDSALRAASAARVAEESLAIEVHKLIGGVIRTPAAARLFSSYERLFLLLLSSEMEARGRLRVVYAQRYGRDLDRAVKRAFPSSRAGTIVALLDNRLGTALVGAMRNIVARKSAEVSEQVFLRFERLIATLPRGERKRIERQFHEDPSSRELFELLSERFSPESVPLLEALVNGSRAQADAAAIRGRIRAEPFPALARLFARDAAERRQIFSAYAGTFGELMSELFQRELDGDLLALARAILDENETRIFVLRVRCVLSRASDEWLGDILRALSHEARATLPSVYEEELVGESFSEALKARFHARDLEIVEDLLRDGVVSPAKLVWFAVSGAGTDERALVSILEHGGTSREWLESEFHRLWKERAPWYERPFPRLFGTLRSRLWMECAGDSWCDLQEFFTADRAELGVRLERIYTHERSGYLLKRLDFFSSEGRVMDRDARLARRFAREKGEAASVQMEFLLRLAELDCSVFRSLKHFIGDTATTVAAGAGGFSAAIAVSFLSEEISHVMLGVGATSLVVRFMMKRLLKGRGYHRDEMLLDAGFAVLDGLTLYVGRIFQKALVRSGTKFTGKLGIKKTIDGILRNIRDVSAEVDSDELVELIEPKHGGESVQEELPCARDTRFEDWLAALTR